VIQTTCSAVCAPTEVPVRSVFVSDLEIRPSRYGAPAAQSLIAMAQAELTERYGTPDENPVESVQFDPPEGAFLVAYRGGVAVACAGWRTLSHFFEDSLAEPLQSNAMEATENPPIRFVDIQFLLLSIYVVSC